MSNHLDASDLGLDSKPNRDSLAVALDAVNDRWSLHVIRAVAFGAIRFTDILREVGAPRDVLSARLRQLTESGILAPAAPERGRHAGYKLTSKGRELGQVILVLKRWGDHYCDDDVATSDFVHTPCGSIFVAQVCCEACGRPVGDGPFSLALRPEDS